MKKLLHNTTKSVEEALTLVASLCHTYGITRSADITDFSPVKLPVWISLRPNAKCLSQSAGKGLCSASSRISSIMEGIEVSIAENVTAHNTSLYSLEEITGSRKKYINLCEFPFNTCLQVGEKIEWSSGYSLIDGEEWSIPTDVLSLDFTAEKFGRKPRRIRSTSNGLASGLTKEEALTSALLETVERHSITLNNKINGNLRVIEIDRSAPPALESVLEELHKNDIKIILYDATIIEGLHAIEAILYSPSGIIEASTGYGCSTSLEIAILRAILEANQAATIFMSGSRDDLPKSTYFRLAESVEHFDDLKRKAKQSRSVKRSEFDFTPLTPSEELQMIIKSIRSCASSNIIAYDYTSKDCPVSVCKVLIPFFEGYYWPMYTPVSSNNTGVVTENESIGIKLAAGGRS